MSDFDPTQLTERQKREVEYHREHAEKHRGVLSEPFEWDMLHNPGRRWWNSYWQMYAFLVQCDLREKRVLIVGCGFGDDALRLAKLGARVSAFDLSPDSLSIARKLADRERLEVAFDRMPSEALEYADNSFDVIIARDILHHVDIPRSMRELVRVAKPDALFVVNEIYSHSATDKVRKSAFVTKVLYPRMRRFIYGDDKPYITEDERKLCESDLAIVSEVLGPRQLDKHFNFLVTRLVSDRVGILARIDRILLILLRPIALMLAGRVLFAARVRK